MTLDLKLIEPILFCYEQFHNLDTTYWRSGVNFSYSFVVKFMFLQSCIVIATGREVRYGGASGVVHGG